MAADDSITYSISADHDYIDMALKARWPAFQTLIDDMRAFKPMSEGEIAEVRRAELERLKGLNPSKPDDELLDLIDRTRGHALNPDSQSSYAFTDRIMAEYVTVAFLSHALAESSINAILAIGLSLTGAGEVFSLLEKADIKEKWTTGPKAFCPSYSLSKSGTLYQTLHHLTRQRNAFTHLKVELEMSNGAALEGSRLDRAPIDAQIGWMHRFFSLPYDLVAHARKAMPNQEVPPLLFDCHPIQRFAPHFR